MNLNKAMLIGNLTRDPEARTTPDGTPVTTFSIATNFRWTDAQGNKQERAEFHNIVAWRKLAEICGQYLKKGARTYVEGRIQTRSWDDQQGTKRYRTEIVAENVIMLDRAGPGNAPAAAAAEPPAPPAAPAEPVINVEEIPF
ncbi:single-stranded DNA-binding protein [Candidatus Uhrbacteria bacterium RIFCSPHIGHO2_12_FULL_54_23]|uniref:Single-stranded DNA-binding protein n=3 Tax=Candidatus Uhriibacteriota TaxID=1752732 RepID=A0A1F7UHZ2_9BACT|nr:MAG: single-stranded DNA-binding protein [Candidatus Uhrbacteria bacterium RIFCSPHIGHO2_12_FULL_54_23]OGL85570.1 MAG: single-stranded DNA-binding protein [Candidatus Uhrbacteria bacterium RIFCSPLOWO2_01_FULL_55_36]OGL89524.1 MAG: single-stranded DNA-binding protein [Candidatus Uhrbacteria bacterium RIFCSPLOWO2_02_FULL_54_37]